MPDPSGRVIPITYGRMLSPAVCGVCRRTGHDNNEMFADPQVYEEYIGSFYVCINCATAIIDIFGGVDSATKERLAEDIRELSAENVLLTSKNARLETLVDALTRDRLIDRDVDLNGNTTLLSEPINFNVIEAGRGAEKTKSEFTEPATSADVASISGTSSGDLTGILAQLGLGPTTS